MPTIAILSPSSVPFTVGGAEKFWWGLHKGLTEFSGAFAELIKIPCREQTFREIVASYRTFSELDLSHFDMVISSKYPAWMVNHPRHVVYMQHPLRGLYDTYHFTHLPERLVDVPAALRDLVNLIRKPSPTRADLAAAFDLLEQAQANTGLPSALFAFPGPLIREVVHFFDRVALNPEQVIAYAAISETVRARTDYFPAGADVKVLHHPSDIVEFADEPGEYIFTASRLTNMKRLHLVVEAMQYVSEPVPLKIAGTGAELERLQSLAGTDRRIEFLGHVPDAQLPELYAKALFVPFVPYDEDYGLITIEAMRSGKPVVTVNDAGGVCEFVFDDATGYCVEPTPEALGAAMQRLAASPELARRLGRNARERVAGITWENTVNALLHHAQQSEAHTLAQGRRKVLVVTTFSAATPVSGGQRRVHHLCAALAKTYFVELVCVGDSAGLRPRRTKVTPFFHEICLPWSAELVHAEEALHAQTGASVEDIACMDTCAHDTALLECLREHGADAELLIASHPYLYPALHEALPHLPLVYDAHNVELDMKTVVLDSCAARAPILERVSAVERACCASAARIFVCADDDARRFEELYGIAAVRTVLVPNGYDAETVSFVGRAQRRSLRERLGYADVPLIFFMGSWHQPNLEAVAHIADLAEQLPEVHFLVAGSVCGEPDSHGDAPKNMHFLGVLQEKEKNVLLSVVDLGINPMASGSGTNLKIIEYLACGLETVTTPFGMRGLDTFGELTGVHVCELDAFAAAITQALRAPAPEAELAATARHMAAHFSWSEVMTPVVAAAETLFGKTVWQADPA